MRIVFVEIRNFRGIKELNWDPSPGVNCLIGPGDSTKTTILDAIELALTPRSYPFADDSDFFDVDVNKPIEIIITLTDLPSEFQADDRYGLHLRGWNATKRVLEDEPGDGLEDALSLRVRVDESLEARWSIFNQRIVTETGDPPGIRYKDSRQIAPTRLGPYAERHLGWGRQSVLTRLGDSTENVNFQLARASRAAREAFRTAKDTVFKATVARAAELGKLFSVPMRDKYSAELDVQGVNITSGGIALHDGNLPLRRLGTGSSRLLVSALQHDAGPSHVALIDEIEHGLEPHRIARLLKFIQGPGKSNAEPQQVFLTTHSPVVIRELTAKDIFRVRSANGISSVDSVMAVAKDPETAQRHLRSTPEAFLAHRLVVGEGKTEQGLLRGLDLCWTRNGQESFALRGVAAINGGGRTEAPALGEYLLDLGYGVLLLLDTDKPAPSDTIERVRDKGGQIFQWPDACSTEERVFLDVPWKIVVSLVELAREFVGPDSVKDNLSNACVALGIAEVTDLGFSASLDTDKFRRALGRGAKNKNNPWFKDIERGERVAELIMSCLADIAEKPLGTAISGIRKWVDG